MNTKISNVQEQASMIEFKVVSVITALISFFLCLVLLFYPKVIFILFNIDENNSAFFIGRRTAMLFLGITVLTWVGRNAPHSESRQAICLGLTISMLALTLLGITEYVHGSAGAGMLLAVITEAILAVLYFKIWFSHKMHHKLVNRVFNE
jgi:peptidoglycan/LPS O-acetylase OafA/YrhL